jgi:hypothetical protein
MAGMPVMRGNTRKDTQGRRTEIRSELPVAAATTPEATP